MLLNLAILQLLIYYIKKPFMGELCVLGIESCAGMLSEILVRRFG